MLSVAQRRRIATGLALVVLSSACGTGGDDPDAVVETPSDTDDPAAADTEHPDQTGTEMPSEDGGTGSSPPDASEPLGEIGPDDLEVASERAAALVRRDTEGSLDLVDDLTADVMYLPESAEPCRDEDGTRYGQTVLLRVEPEDQAEVLTRLGGRFEAAGFELHEDDDGIATIRDDGSQRWVGPEAIGPQDRSTLAYIAMGSCESTAEEASPFSLAEASSALELPAAFVFDALAGDAAAAGDEGATMGCEDGRVASFLTMSALLKRSVGPDTVHAELAAAFPGARQLDHGAQATDVITDEGTVTVRTRGDRLTVATRTRCVESEAITP